jgi:formamidopyrimidine-DNA glycosylase
MFELPEIETLVKQINQTLSGKIIHNGSLGNSPHKFVWYNRTHEEFESLIKDKTVGKAYGKGRWLFIDIDPGFVLVFGEMGGRMLFHPAGSMLPAKYHLYLEFDDKSFFTATTQMWGAMELYRKGEEQERQYVKGMRTTPLETGFTFEYFTDLIDQLLQGEKRSVKSLLTQDQIIPGLGNSIAQDIMFKAGLNPRHPLGTLDLPLRQKLYAAIRDTIQQVIAGGGRNDELDLYNRPGNYVRIMDNDALKRPCPTCGGKIEKMAYLGGNCYYCPHCQV